MSYRCLAFASLVVFGAPLASVACGGTAAPRPAATFVQSADGQSTSTSACNVDRFWERSSPLYEPCADEAKAAQLPTEASAARGEKHVATAAASPSCGRDCRFDEDVHAKRRSGAIPTTTPSAPPPTPPPPSASPPPPPGSATPPPSAAPPPGSAPPPSAPPPTQPPPTQPPSASVPPSAPAPSPAAPRPPRVPGLAGRPRPSR